MAGSTYQTYKMSPFVYEYTFHNSNEIIFWGETFCKIFSWSGQLVQFVLLNSYLREMSISNGFVFVFDIISNDNLIQRIIHTTFISFIFICSKWFIHSLCSIKERSESRFNKNRSRTTKLTLSYQVDQIFECNTKKKKKTKKYIKCPIIVFSFILT